MLEALAWIVAGVIALYLAFWIVVLAWPLLLCWYLGYPVVGVIAEVIYLASMR